MNNIKDIKDRIKSVREIRKITRAMKMVATAKYTKSQNRLNENALYRKKIEDLLLSVNQEVVRRYNPFFNTPVKARKKLLVIVSSDKGLCGGFNANISRFADKRIEEESYDVLLIGKKGVLYYKREKTVDIAGEFKDVFSKLSFKNSQKISEAVKQLFYSGKYQSIEMLFHHFESMGRQTVVCEQILPILDTDNLKPDDEKSEQGKKENPPVYVYEGSAESVFGNLINHFIDLKVIQVLLESELSEHITRMNAMDAATKNASDLIDSLILEYNRARQSIITTEIIEIVGGSEALKK
ncbi:ATP synthase F1 subunit gamma [bacterium]|nr:ATP synthase F1 subunit gamma [bacterium]